MGGHEITEKISRGTMKAIYQTISMYGTKAQIQIFDYMYQILDDDKNDRGLSVLTS